MLWRKMKDRGDRKYQNRLLVFSVVAILCTVIRESFPNNMSLEQGQEGNEGVSCDTS